MRTLASTLCLFLLTLSPNLHSAQGDNEELQALVDELKQITQKARQQRAADRWLLNDLEDLVARHEWPWRSELLLEDFSDGDFTNDPQWQVISGQFWVDGRLGLRSQNQGRRSQERRDEPEKQQKQEQEQDIGRALLGALLQEALRDDSRNSKKESSQRQPQQDSSQPAEIQLVKPVPLVFASKFEFSAHNRPSANGQLEFALVQDQRGANGYRVALYLGQRASLELLSVLNGRTRVINAVNIDDISDGQSHTLEWRRDGAGQIEILLDENSLFQTQDRSFRYPFKRLSITNQSGDFAISSVSLYGE